MTQKALGVTQPIQVEGTIIAIYLIRWPMKILNKRPAIQQWAATIAKDGTRTSRIIQHQNPTLRIIIIVLFQVELINVSELLDFF